MVEGNVFKTFAEEGAKAVSGMKPNINIWSTGTGTDANPIQNLIRNMPPLSEYLKQQTGIDLNGFLSEKMRCAEPEFVTDPEIGAKKP